MNNLKTFTPFEYLCIDLANHFGNDKWEFEDRIQWVFNHIRNDTLISLVDDPKADKKTLPLLKKAIMEIDRARKGEASGHTVGLDATCSGMQILSCLTGCIAGATATGLVIPNKRMDAYNEVTSTMNQQDNILVRVPRDDAKQAVMTSIYGSRAKPKEIFGEDSPELNAFYKAMGIVCPGAWQALEDLRNAWTPYALAHAWKLPDGFDARVKVMEKVEKRVEIDELGHATFTHEFYVNQGSKQGISLVANVTHSVDGYVVRTMQRRCNYDMDVVLNAMTLLTHEELNRVHGEPQQALEEGTKLRYYVDQYNRSTVADVVILPYLTTQNVSMLSDKHIAKLISIINQMLQHNPFELITVHDAFHAHPNNCNWVRSHYREILADLADSELMTDLLNQLYKSDGKFTKLSQGLGDIIRKSNYGLS